MTIRSLKAAGVFVLLVLSPAAQLVSAQDTRVVAGPTMPDYRIGTFDELQVTVSSPVAQLEFSLKNYRVQSDGTVQLPKLDKPVKVGGMTTQQAREAIRLALIEAQQYAAPTVDVQVAVYRNSNVTVQGAVRSPGSVDIQANRMTISEAISRAGGLQPSAGSRVYVRGGPNRPKPEADVRIEDGREVFSRDDVLAGRVLDPRVYDGDTIEVEVAPHFYVTGHVKQSQSEYNWEPGINLNKAIAMAGGPAPDGAVNRVSIQRKDPKTGAYKEIKLLKDKMSTPIEPEDVIKVPKKRA